MDVKVKSATTSKKRKTNMKTEVASESDCSLPKKYKKEDKQTTEGSAACKTVDTKKHTEVPWSIGDFIMDVKVKSEPTSKKRKTNIKTEAVSEDNCSLPKKYKKEDKQTTEGSAACKTVTTKKHTEVSWSIGDVISRNLGIHTWCANNVVNLLEDGCTIPFIARYRKEQTNGMEVKKLRDICSLVEELRNVETKVASAKAVIRDKGKLTKELDSALSNSKTLEEVEVHFAPFKPGHKGSLAERAKALGLEPLALKFLSGSCSNSEAQRYVNVTENGLKDVTTILEGVQHIIADIIHKDASVMELVRNLSTSSSICISSTKTNAKKVETKPGVRPEPAHKYELYFDTKISIPQAQPHQILAINRGESHKILSVKVIIPQSIESQIMQFCWKKWLHKSFTPDTKTMVTQSMEDAYKRLIQPQICRTVRSNLTKNAEKASIEVFVSNLTSLLLSAPLKGFTILAIDPGFSNGCKTAVISKTGQVLATEVIMMHTGKANSFVEQNKLKKLVNEYNCDVVAIGNGVGCRETETYMSDFIKNLCPNLKYCIVCEDGASIYSVSDIAQLEMPDLDPSLRGAVSIGRRLLDPLSEYVKVDPKSIGVGQYQHDMPQNELKASLDSTIQECVSFVGVDINTCSEHLLSHVSGMSKARAKKLLEFRDKFGSFVCREQLMAVKGLGAKTYEQAAGFIRIHTDAASLSSAVITEAMTKTEKKPKKGGKKKESQSYSSNPLDMTWIHPESYELTHRLLKKMCVKVVNIGQSDFIHRVKCYVNDHGIKEISDSLECGEPTTKLIIDALLRPLSYDLRDEFKKPLFRNSVKSIKDLKFGDRVTGVVRNVTNFGAFVDIGVGECGLMHQSKMVPEGSWQKYQVKLGEKVEVKIENVDQCRKRIGLCLVKVL